MRRSIFFIGVLAMVFTLFGGSAWAQFSPGKEGVASGSGNTLLEVKQVNPGKAVLIVTNAKAVFLNVVPPDVKVNFTGKDVSGKGTSYVADVSGNPALANHLYGWRGVGSDWNVQVNGAISHDGLAEVSVDFGVDNSQDRLVGLIPVMSKDGLPSKKPIWAAHPENTALLFPCRTDSGKNVRDMVSLFLIDKASGVHIVKGRTNQAEIVAKYGAYYATFCGIGR